MGRGIATDQPLFASASRVADTYESATIPCSRVDLIEFECKVTAGSGTVVFQVQTSFDGGTTWEDVGGAVTAALSPTTTARLAVTRGDGLGSAFRLEATVASADTTFEARASLWSG